MTIGSVLRAEEILELALYEQARARSIIAGLGSCPVIISRGRVTLGAFLVDRHDGSTEIRISRHIRTEEQVRETMRHELAHQAAWERYEHFGHGPYWQTFASYLGCQPVRCAQSEPEDDADARYAVMCTNCDWSTTRFRRSKLIRAPWRFSCAACGSKLRVLALAGAQ